MCGSIFSFGNYYRRGYGLVVECVLAKDETGVRFSLPAQGAREAKACFWFRVTMCWQTCLPTYRENVF